MTVTVPALGKTAQLDAYATYWGATPIFRGYSGVPPTDVNTALSGNTILFAVVPTPAAAAVAGAGATKDMLGGTKSTTGLATGKARFYRVYASDGSTVKEQGLISAPWLASTPYVIDDQVHNGGNVYRATAAGTSAGSGGPTGTGSGITDGGVTWTYIGTVDVTMANPSVAPSQPVEVTGLTKTLA